MNKAKKTNKKFTFCNEWVFFIDILLVIGF